MPDHFTPALADNAKLATTRTKAGMRKNDWSDRVMALLQGGNAPAALAQIKVAPDPKDLAALRKAMIAVRMVGRWPSVDTAIKDNFALLSAPRLHRSP
jgi:hypothetical protein